jgi:diapolycopene oxygenase
MKEVIVIGGGLGGMSAAITLAKHQEFKITLIEKNPHLGGKLNVLEQDGFSFDLGPSIFTMPQYFDALFEMHGKERADYFKLVSVTPHWRNFFEDGTTIDLADTLEGMKALDNITEKDYEELQAFYSYTEKLYDFTNEILFKNQAETILQTLKYYPPLKILKDSDYFRTMDEGIRKYITNPYLIDIMNYFIKYVGSNPYDAPAVMNLLPYIQWKFGLWYVEGGMSQASIGLQKLMKELGITVKTNTEVISVEKQKGRISKITLSDGTTKHVDVVVSNMEAIPFYEKITQEPEKKLRNLKKKYGPACSGFALHLGVNKQYPQLAHHNFFFSKELKQNFDNIFKKHKLSGDPTIYLVAPMKTDPSQGPEGHEIIKILPHISVIKGDKAFSKEEYEAFEDAVLTKLERMGLTDLRKHIVSKELWTPETIQQTYYSNQGAIYGVEANRKMNLGFKVPKTSSYYNNLFFVGGSTNPGGGMPMVVLSGQQVEKHVLRSLK